MNPQPRDYESPALTVELQAPSMIHALAQCPRGFVGLLPLARSSAFAIQRFQPAKRVLQVRHGMRQPVVTLEFPASFMIVNVLAADPPGRVRLPVCCVQAKAVLLIFVNGVMVTHEMFFSRCSPCHVSAAAGYANSGMAHCLLQATS